MGNNKKADLFHPIRAGSALSNESPSNFQWEGKSFVSFEQYLQFRKAEHFEDADTAADILSATKLDAFNALGKKIKKFCPAKWEMVSREFIGEGLPLKFDVESKARAELLGVEKKTFLYYDPGDKLLGCDKLNMNAKFNADVFEGKNLMGELLSEFRDRTLDPEGADARAAEKEREKERQTAKASHALKRSESSGEKYTFFWGNASPFSQFHSCQFSIDGKKFSCAEQWMMYSKAVHFDNLDIAKEILECHDPKKIKAFGRQVVGFSDQEWDKVKIDIVKKGNMAKFTQNPSLKDHLLATHGSVLVEASPFDNIWGIGLSAENPKAFKKRTWQGANLLGYVITEVREKLLEAEGARESTRAVEFEWKNWREEYKNFRQRQGRGRGGPAGRGRDQQQQQQQQQPWRQNQGDVSNWRHRNASQSPAGRRNIGEHHRSSSQSSHSNRRKTSMSPGNRNDPRRSGSPQKANGCFEAPSSSRHMERSSQHDHSPRQRSSGSLQPNRSSSGGRKDQSDGSSARQEESWNYVGKKNKHNQQPSLPDHWEASALARSPKKNGGSPGKKVPSSATVNGKESGRLEQNEAKTKRHKEQYLPIGKSSTSPVLNANNNASEKLGNCDDCQNGSEEGKREKKKKKNQKNRRNDKKKEDKAKKEQEKKQQKEVSGN